MRWRQDTTWQRLEYLPILTAKPFNTMGEKSQHSWFSHRLSNTVYTAVCLCLSYSIWIFCQFNLCDYVVRSCLFVCSNVLSHYSRTWERRNATSRWTRGVCYLTWSVDSWRQNFWCRGSQSCASISRWPRFPVSVRAKEELIVSRKMTCALNHGPSATSPPSTCSQ